jgi:acyl-CoA thioester hydrolase
MEQVNPARTDYLVLRPLMTRWADNDVYGHVNNVVYYSYFDTAVNGWLMDATGTDIRLLPAIGIVAETSCRFLAPLSFPDLVTAGLRLRHLGTSSVVYDIGLFRNDDEAPAGVGHFVHVYVDSATRRPVPVPPLIRNALAALR